jgi:hypothetical protein
VDHQSFLAPGPGDIDSRLLQAPHVVLPPVGVDEVKCAITLLETLLDEGEQHSVFFLLAVEERTDVPLAIEDRTR